MIVDMRTQDLDLAGAVQRHVERRIRAALGSSEARIRSVSLALSDVNGPRGGLDLRCAVTVELAPRGWLRVEATGSDLFSAIGQALARARRSIRGAPRDHGVRGRVSPREGRDSWYEGAGSGR